MHGTLDPLLGELLGELDGVNCYIRVNNHDRTRLTSGTVNVQAIGVYKTYTPTPLIFSHRSTGIKINASF